VSLDGLCGRVLTLPPQSLPLQAVTSISSIDTAGGTNILDPANYVVDLASGRVGLALGGVWPTDLRPFQPFTIRIVSGCSSDAQIPPLLVHAIGLLTAHYATAGRDVVGPLVSDTPYGYADAIAPYHLVSVA